MTLYLLNGGEQVSLPTRPLVVRVQSAGAQLALRLSATVAPGAQPPVAIERHGMLVLPRLVSLTTVQLSPPPGLDLFAPQTVLNVMLGPDGGDPNADYVQVTVDVSGLPVANLLTLDPQGSSITVSALGRRKDPPLPPHAELARDVARELLGVASVDPDDAVDVVVGVDCSPSMRMYASDGSLEAVLETFAGVASVIDPNGEVEAVLVGREAIRLEPLEIQTFARSTIDRVQHQPLVTGLRSRALPPARLGTLSFLVTDAVPADRSALSDKVHLVILSDRGDITAPANGSETASIATATRAGDGPLRWDRREAKGIVSALLAGYSERGSR